MEKQCIKCSSDYDYYPIQFLEEQTSLCKDCRFFDNCGKSTRMTRCKNNNCLPCYNTSFLSVEKSSCWDYTKNKTTPRQISKNAHKKYWFICDECGHNIELVPNTVTSGSWCSFCKNMKRCEDEKCVFCYNHSFASHNRSKYWDYTKNKETPRQVSKSNNIKYWFTCDICNHSIHISPSKILAGRWCSFCKNMKRCEDEKCVFCYNHSFASHNRSKYWDYTKNKETPRQISKNAKKKYWFICKCGHNIYLAPRGISNSCLFCVNMKRCEDEKCVFCYNHSFASHEKCKYWDYSKNKETPRHVPKATNNKYWFICENKHEIEVQLNSVSSGNWCRFCTRKTEKKFAEWLKGENISFEREKTFPWCQNEKTKRYFPFDFVLEKEKIIIELDGSQHFKQIMNWTSPEIVQERDKFKQDKAIENGYTIIRVLQIDVFKKIYWKKLLIKNIHTRTEPEIIFINKNCEYENTHSSRIYSSRTELEE